MIRQATVKDAPSISKIHASSWKAAYQSLLPRSYLDGIVQDFWVEPFTTWLSTGEMTAQMVFDMDIPVGCIAYCKSREASLADWAEIVSIYLLPDYFGKGLGKKLMFTAMEDLKKQGFTNLFLWVLEGNQRASLFYENLGFTPTEDRIKMDIGGKEIFDQRYIFSFK